MRPSDSQLACFLDRKLRSFEQTKYQLPGIRAASSRTALIEQLVESVRRIRYVNVIRDRIIRTHNWDNSIGDPRLDCFDPLKTAVIRQIQGNLDEAFWLVFLSVHFGRNRRTGWRLVREVYGALGTSSPWTWAATSANPDSFRRWLRANRSSLTGHFGNHRKYESLADEGTGRVIASYIEWIAPPRTHHALFMEASRRVSGDRKAAFDALYSSLGAVSRFGRTARFDYLTMVGKLTLAPIEPGSTYMVGATGPFAGAQLLFTGKVDGSIGRRVLDAWLAELGAHLDLPFVMQVLEDALCNWQKAPKKFVPFRG